MPAAKRNHAEDDQPGNAAKRSRTDEAESRSALQVGCQSARVQAEVAALLEELSTRDISVTDRIRRVTYGGKTTEQFVAEVQLLWPNYDFRQVDYINSKVKVVVGCPKHGLFAANPSNLRQNHGCPGCKNQGIGDRCRKTFLQFLHEARLRHGDSCDYSGSVYVNNHEALDIVCRQHGAFQQTAAVHLASEYCCPVGGNEANAAKRRKPLDTFIAQCIELHGDRYDYGSVTYVNNATHVEVICKIHGIFSTSPQNHLDQGFGCPGCFPPLNASPTTEEFVKKATRKCFGKDYDYSEVIYAGHNVKVKIGCPKHGFFEITPNNLMNDHGCARCVMSSYSKKAIAWLQYVEDTTGLQIQHAENGKEKTIGRYRCDGFSAETNTVYEFHGDFWHGNPSRYDAEFVNPMNGKTMGELFKKTVAREEVIRDLGYNVVTMWEADWDEIQRQKRRRDSR